MASVRSATFSLRLLRSSSHYLFNFKKPALQKLVKFRNVLYASVASLTVGTGLCAIPFKQVENLSHDTLIGRAASLVTDSSSTFLSQTTLALIDAIAEYSKAVHTLIAVHKRYLDLLGKLSPAEEDSVWQVIIGQRAQVDDRWNECKRFESTWVSALRLCETAAEAAYTSGAEHASITVRTHIQVAQSQVDEAQKLSLDAEKKLAETKVMEVERMAQHAVSSQSHNDEDEVPDAYLRED